MIDNNVIWELDRNVRYRRVFDEAVLIHQHRPEALVLNDSAVAFLELCDGQRNAGEIIKGLGNRYGVEDESLSQDLQPYIEELVSEGIIHQLNTD